MTSEKDTSATETASIFSEAPTLIPEAKQKDGRPVVGGRPDNSYYYTETRVVKAIPKSYQRANGMLPASRFDKLKAALQPPASRKFAAIPNKTGTTYHVNEKGEIIETKTVRSMQDPHGVIAIIPPVAGGAGF